MNLQPYLIFDGQCEDAFHFYRQHLGGELTAMMRFDEMPGGEPVPEGAARRIMHARLEVDGFVLMASDNHPDHPYEGIKGCSISLGVAEVAEAERLFAALSEGGSVQMPLQETFWAARFAMLVDRFGVPWMINCERRQ